MPIPNAPLQSVSLAVSIGNLIFDIVKNAVPLSLACIASVNKVDGCSCSDVQDVPFFL